MPARPWYPRNPGDSHRETADFDLEEFGAHIRLQDHAWDHDGLIPKDARRLGKILKVHTNKAKTLWGFVRSKWYETPLGFRNTEIDKMLAQAVEKQEKARESANARWHANAMRTHMRTQCSPTTTSTEEKDTPPVVPPTEKAKPPRSTRGTRLPNDWKPPPEFLSWAREHGNGLDIALEAEKFRDHFTAAPGQRGVKLDWLATWRNWIRNAGGRTHAQNGRHRDQPRSAVERVQRANKLGPWAEQQGRIFDAEPE